MFSFCWKDYHLKIIYKTDENKSDVDKATVYRQTKKYQLTYKDGKGYFATQNLIGLCLEQTIAE